MESFIPDSKESVFPWGIIYDGIADRTHWNIKRLRNGYSIINKGLTLIGPHVERSFYPIDPNNLSDMIYLQDHVEGNTEKS